MPFIVPFIPLIVGGITAASTISGLVNRPSGAPPSAPAPTPTTPTTPSLTQAQKAQATQAGANLQAATGGGLSPEAWLQNIMSVSGMEPSQTGQLQSIINTAFGLGAPTGNQGGGRNHIIELFPGNSIGQFNH